MKKLLFILCSLSFLASRSFAGSLSAKVTEPEREVLRLPYAVPLSLSLPERPVVFYLADSVTGADAKRPLFNFRPKLEAVLSYAGFRVSWISGGAQLVTEMHTRQAFGRTVGLVTVQTNTAVLGGSVVTNVSLLTNVVIEPMGLLPVVPDYILSAEIVDALEEVETKSRRTWWSLLLGPLTGGYTVDFGLRWRKSTAHVRVTVTIKAFDSEIRLAQGDIRGTVIRRERGQSYGIRYSSRAGASVDLDDTTADSLEEVLSAACARAFVIAFCRLSSLDPGLVCSSTRSDEVTRERVQLGWRNASPERRRKTVELAKRLASANGVAVADWPDPESALEGCRWQRLLENLPIGRFDPAPHTRLRRDVRVVFEHFPKDKWEHLRPLVSELLLKLPGVKRVEPDVLAPDLVFRVGNSPLMGKIDPEKVREVVVGEMERLTGMQVDSHLMEENRTVYIKYRPTLSPVCMK